MSWCNIYITERLWQTFSEAERFGVFAHEAGHVAQLARGEKSDNSVERECAADEFAIKLLYKSGRDPRALIAGLKKSMHSYTFLLPANRSKYELRIKNAERIISALQK